MSYKSTASSSSEYQEDDEEPQQTSGVGCDAGCYDTDIGAAPAPRPLTFAESVASRRPDCVYETIFQTTAKPGAPQPIGANAFPCRDKANLKKAVVLDAGVKSLGGEKLPPGGASLNITNKSSRGDPVLPSKVRSADTGEHLGYVVTQTPDQKFHGLRVEHHLSSDHVSGADIGGLHESDLKNLSKMVEGKADKDTVDLDHTYVSHLDKHFPEIVKECNLGQAEAMRRQQQHRYYLGAARRIEGSKLGVQARFVRALHKLNSGTPSDKSPYTDLNDLAVTLQHPRRTQIAGRRNGRSAPDGPVAHALVRLKYLVVPELHQAAPGKYSNAPSTGDDGSIQL